MAKDERERDAGGADTEAARLLSPSPPLLEDDANLTIYQNPQHPSASLSNSNAVRFSPPPGSMAHNGDQSAVSGPDKQDIGPVTAGPNSRPNHTRRQSSFAQHRPDGTPRTPNRVRFEVDDREVGTHAPPSSRHFQVNGFPPGGNGHARHDPFASSWLQEEDYMASPVDGAFNGLGSGRQGENGVQRVPLLTDIEAPSVTVATPGQWDEGDEEIHTREIMTGGGRAKSGMSSAFMNMANSIMYATPSPFPRYHFSRTSFAATILPNFSHIVAEIGLGWFTLVVEASG
ncbi:MAG: hypothetical protein M1821_005916 [Bathelium mastoideum]|nr:MAG: hypothetical protein M1821_005916 [Bathelium mastoideum]KAI9688545.1 MAG: hypothetical protein M1822_001494 [Bathelium mastoideum]